MTATFGAGTKLKARLHGFIPLKATALFIVLSPEVAPAKLLDATEWARSQTWQCQSMDGSGDMVALESIAPICEGLFSSKAWPRFAASDAKTEDLAAQNKGIDNKSGMWSEVRRT